MILEQMFAQWSRILEFVSKLRRQGIPRWNAETDFDQYARAVGDNGRLYRSLVATGPAAGNAQDPTTETDPRAIWKEDGPSEAPPHTHNYAAANHSHPGSGGASGLVAYGRVLADGSLRPGGGGISAVVRENSGTASNPSYTLMLRSR